MTMSRRDALVAGAVALPATGLFLAAARGQTGTAVQPMGEDPLLAACLLVDGRKQIEKCQFAKGRVQNEDVKAFAQAEIDEHQTIKTNLQQIGFEYPAAAVASAPSAAPAPAAAAPAPAILVGRVTIPPPASNQLLVSHEVAQQCVANFQAAMQKKEAQKGKLKLDKAFVGDQLHEHYGLLDKAQVFSKHASPQMQPLLKTGLEIILKHIATLEGLMEKLDQMAMRSESGGDK